MMNEKKRIRIEKNPKVTSSYLTSLTHSWITPHITKVYQNEHYDGSTSPPIVDGLHAKMLREKIVQIYDRKESKQGKHWFLKRLILFRTILKLVGMKFFAAQLFYFVHVMIAMTFPYFQKLYIKIMFLNIFPEENSTPSDSSQDFISRLESKEVLLNPFVGVMIIVLLSFLTMIDLCVVKYAREFGNFSSLKTVSALTCLMYDRMFYLDKHGINITNLNYDCFLASQIPKSFHYIWETPLLFCSSLFFLYVNLRWIALLLLAVVAVALPINIVLSLTIIRFQVGLSNQLQKNTNYLKDVLSKIYVIKIHALEEFFKKYLLSKRKLLLYNVLGLNIPTLLLNHSLTVLPLLSQILLFSITFFVRPEGFTIENIFSSVTFLVIFFNSFIYFPINLNIFIKGCVSIAKLQSILEQTMEEKERCGKVYSSNIKKKKKKKKKKKVGKKRRKTRTTTDDESNNNISSSSSIETVSDDDEEETPKIIREEVISIGTQSTEEENDPNSKSAFRDDSEEEDDDDNNNNLRTRRRKKSSSYRQYNYNDDVSNRNKNPVLISFEKGMSYPLSNKRELKFNIDVSIREGEFVIVVGQVGSGKSTFFELLLKSYVPEYKVSFCPQQMWLKNDTLEKNILFGRRKNVRKLNRILRMVKLEKDLEQYLPNGLETELGAHGVNLSGGQKQRASLARGLYYTSAQIYLLDQSFSFLDSELKRKIFTDVIRHLKRRKKTVILITNERLFLPIADQVILIKDMMIHSKCNNHESFTPEQIRFLTEDHTLVPKKKNKDELEAEDLEEDDDEILEEEEEEEEMRMKFLKKRGFLEPGSGKCVKVVKEEEIVMGQIKWDTIAFYFKNLGVFRNTFFVVLTLIFLLFFSVFINVVLKLPNVLLSIWSTSDNKEDSTYVIIYFSLGVAIPILVILKFGLIVWVGFYSGVRIYELILENLLTKKLKFFQEQPLGRILHRLSHDLYRSDVLFQSLDMFFNGMVQFILYFLVISMTNYFLVIVLVVVFIFLMVVFSFYRNASLKQKRVAINSTAPVYSFFLECCEGSDVIRTFQKQGFFFRQFRKILNHSINSHFLHGHMNLWFYFRVQYIVYFVFILFLIFMKFFSNVGGLVIFIGMSMSQLMTISDSFNFVLSYFITVSEEFSCVEKLQFYAKKKEGENFLMEKEAAILNIKHISKPSPKKDHHHHHPENHQVVDDTETKDAINQAYEDDIEISDRIVRLREIKKIRFRNVDFAYYDSKQILFGVNFEVTRRDKIKIIGRTGSGKSSLYNVLLNFWNFEGNVLLNGKYDIRNISNLREKIFLSTQEPHLFENRSIRFNLDPEHRFLEAGLYQKLREVGLGKLKLKHKIKNCSYGEKQCISLSKMLLHLHQYDVICFDEPFSNMDEKYMNVIFGLLTEKKIFQQKIVFFISHKPNFKNEYFNKILKVTDGHVSIKRNKLGLSDEELMISSSSESSSTTTSSSSSSSSSSDSESTNNSNDSNSSFVDDELGLSSLRDHLGIMNHNKSTNGDGRGDDELDRFRERENDEIENDMYELENLDSQLNSSDDLDDDDVLDDSPIALRSSSSSNSMTTTSSSSSNNSKRLYQSLVATTSSSSSSASQSYKNRSESHGGIKRSGVDIGDVLSKPFGIIERSTSPIIERGFTSSTIRNPISPIKEIQRVSTPLPIRGGKKDRNIFNNSSNNVNLKRSNNQVDDNIDDIDEEYDDDDFELSLELQMMNNELDQNIDD